MRWSTKRLKNEEVGRGYASGSVRCVKFEYRFTITAGKSVALPKVRTLSQKITSRRDFLALTGTAAFTALLPSRASFGFGENSPRSERGAADTSCALPQARLRSLRSNIVSTITYNGQFPGPVLRFKEGQPVSVEVRNDTDTPEQLHWHGQMVSTDVDGAAEEGTPLFRAHGMRGLHSLRAIGFSFLSHAQSGGCRFARRTNTAARSDRSTSSPSMIRGIPCAGIKGVPSSAAPSTSVETHLAVPMQLLGSVRVVADFYAHGLPLFKNGGQVLGTDRYRLSSKRCASERSQPGLRQCARDVIRRAPFGLLESSRQTEARPAGKQRSKRGSSG